MQFPEEAKGMECLLGHYTQMNEPFGVTNIKYQLIYQSPPYILNISQLVHVFMSYYAKLLLTRYYLNHDY